MRPPCILLGTIFAQRKLQITSVLGVKKMGGGIFLLKSNENDTFFRILFGHIKTFYYFCTKFENRRHAKALGTFGESAPKKPT